MGSGETAPTMVKLHRSLIAHAGEGLRVMLDTPFGFQANADDLTGKVQEYFADAVGQPIEAARWRRRDEPAAVHERSVDVIGRSRYAFAGPGSPTYALSQWRDTPIPEALADVVGRGGTVVLGSAAAVTAGSWSVPVYEIYKVGEEPHWVPGLDLLGTLLGLDVAVIPHFDNREGGRHDTRFCYLGEERLAVMESLLADGVGVLGVDEHTAVVLDAVTREVSVHGAGGLTVRAQGRVHVVPAGEGTDVDALARLLAGEGGVASSPSAATPAPPPVEVEARVSASLRDVAAGHRARFDAHLAAGDADAAVEEALALEDAIHAWSTDTLQGSDADAARRVLRAMLVELATAAREGLRDPRTLLDPVVQVVLAARAQARAAKDFALSDLLRDELLAVGIEVRDTPQGQEWVSTEGAG